MIHYLLSVDEVTYKIQTHFWGAEGVGGLKLFFIIINILSFISFQIFEVTS